MVAPIQEAGAKRCKRCMNCKCNKGGGTASKATKTGGKKKRKPSAYNKFVKSYLAKNKGKKLGDAAKAWKCKK